MSKQIYIDSNGNEVLVSGTIATAGNLPLGTTTPTGSTAEAIAGKQPKPTIYAPSTTTATITVPETWNACLVVVTRRWIPYNACFIFTGANSVSESQIIELYKGSNVTLAKTDGNKVTITSDQLATSEISVTPLIGTFSISG